VKSMNESTNDCPLLWKEESYCDDAGVRQVIAQTPLPSAINSPEPRFFIFFPHPVRQPDGSVTIQRIGPVPSSTSSVEETFLKFDETAKAFIAEQSGKIVVPGRNGLIH